MRGHYDHRSATISSMKYAVLLLMALVACTPSSGSDPSVEGTTTSDLIGFPCVSQSGSITGDTGVTVESNGHEVSAALGWVSAGPCPDEDSDGVVSDGFFAGVEEAVVPAEAGETIRVRASGFSEATFEASWSDADGIESEVDAAEIEPGVWQIDDFSEMSRSYVLNLRFRYGSNQDAAFAVTVDVTG